MGITIPSFLILLGILIFVHELGHFLVAKRLGIKVLRFSLGFGPILFKRTKGETEYALSAIPLGGYVKLFGEEPGEELAPEDVGRSFSARPVGHRIATYVAGPLMNFVLAIVIFTILSLFGTQIGLPVVGDVADGMPAQQAGIESGDRIVAVDGQDVDTWEDMALEIALTNPGEEIEIVVEREGTRIPFRLTPKMEPQGPAQPDRPLIGIGWSGAVESQDIPLWRAPIEGVTQTWRVTVITMEVVWRLITGKGSRFDVGGPIAIADMAGKAARAGWMAFVFVMASLSINLGVLNLMPIPVLDGGHLFFCLIEAVRGKPVSLRYREIAQQFGLAIILTLIVYIVYVDILRIRLG